MQECIMIKLFSISVMLLSFTFICIPFVNSAYVEDERNNQAENETIRLFEELLKDYDSRIRPYYGVGKPVEVTVELGVVSFESVSETNLDFTINTYLTQVWTDPRLRYKDSLKLPPTSHYVDEFWLPDLIFIHAKHGYLHDVTVENKVIEISPNGTVSLIQRLRLTLACAMDFTYFPLDHQNCAVDMESFEYSTDDLVFELYDELPVFLFQEHSKIPQFSVKGANFGNCTKSLRIGKVSCVRVEFVFNRDIGYYLLHAYVPSFMLVLMAWVSFWIDIQSAPARVALGITTILSMLTTSNGIRSDLPRVSYIKAIDIWFEVCFVFVIGSLVEYAIVHSISKGDICYHKNKRSRKCKPSTVKHREEKSPGNGSQPDDENGIDVLFRNRHDRRVTFEMESSEEKAEHSLPSEFPPEDDNMQEQKQVGNGMSQKQKRRFQRACEIDTLARVVYPLFFVIFVVCYLIIFVPEEERTDITIEELENAFTWD
ncbi:Glycine receptor subunit alpha-2 [Holothuria leucospilota]|uniref:Glycine receptor subunit alpha-2 n=1 Tax=Holothuria leucospilota TaxID=206669 RepID=A0A9Q1H374_HOLLE|nr:Glycine receptor subunit alpha-2 [Holothuria leucospilota]